MGSKLCKKDNAVHASQQIDMQLNKEANSMPVKILLLGGSDAGKSTMMKQVRLIHGSGFSDTELIDAVFNVRSNILICFHYISEAIYTLDMEVAEEELILLDFFRLQPHDLHMMTEEKELEIMMKFWQKSQKEKATITELQTRKTIFQNIPLKTSYKLVSLVFLTVLVIVVVFFRLIVRQLPVCLNFIENRPFYPTIPDNFQFYRPHLARILAHGYVPTVEDILNVKSSSLGVHEICFHFNQQIGIRLIDVGGQRTERRKWIHFFEDVSIILFVTSLTSYNQQMEEEMKPPFAIDIPIVRRQATRDSTLIPSFSFSNEANKTRLQDSIDLFHNIAKNAFLGKSSFVLFLNKIDLLDEKLKFQPFIQHFPTYVGANTEEGVCEFIGNQFKNAFTSDDRELFIHRTSATQTGTFSPLFDLICHEILEKNIQEEEEVCE